ncbi:hypothetical protein JTB14_014500 [Gonioctena quinquepunctata]|nr:hypothetical protein JTB14_014500 [Gonioctena quinquepunctata]
MEDIRITEMDRLCRTCLSEKNMDELKFIFENSLEVQLREITTIKVEANDGLPSYMCNDCHFTLKVALNFKNQCQKSESQLRNVLNPNQTIIYRAITILGDNSGEYQIQKFDDLQSTLQIMKNPDVVSDIVEETTCTNITPTEKEIKPIHTVLDITENNDNLLLNLDHQTECAVILPQKSFKNM